MPRSSASCGTSISLFNRPSAIQNRNETRRDGREPETKYRKVESGVININYKVLDTTTMQNQVHPEHRCQNRVSERRLQEGGQWFLREAWLNPIRTIARNQCTALATELFPDLVIRFQNNQIYLNCWGTGIDVGDVKELFSTGEDLVDPATGRSLGNTGDSLGKIRIVRVSPKFSVAVPVSEMLDKPKAGDTVR